MIKSFDKGSEISYQYKDYNTYNVLFANNISAFCFTGSGTNNLKSQLKSIEKVDKNVKKIKSYAFDNCSRLQIINIADSSIDVLQANSFNDCTNLMAIIVPKSLIENGMALSALNNLPSLHVFSFYNQERDEQ